MTHPYLDSHAKRQSEAEAVVRRTGYGKVSDVKDHAPKMPVKEPPAPRETKNNVEKDLL
jgi:hypothetical protein